MDEVLTIDEIKARFDGEWVLVGDPVTDEFLEVRSGRVLSHSKDRDEVYRRAAVLRPARSAMLCFVEPPEGMEFAL
jgi:hypothetical protein